MPLFFYYFFTASFNLLPALNAGTSVAAISCASPVLGFLPIRASLCLFSNVPKPGTTTPSPSAAAEIIVSMVAFTIKGRDGG